MLFFIIIPQSCAQAHSRWRQQIVPLSNARKPTVPVALYGSACNGTAIVCYREQVLRRTPLPIHSLMAGSLPLLISVTVIAFPRCSSEDAVSLDVFRGCLLR